ncbi:hypothetical protein LJC71_05080 [Desulfosarcina sp. OttesenSCG-928-A07]|nr:hypothetical protein [Desulfosarcina sp. OttesenSCG-928-A07]
MDEKKRKQIEAKLMQLFNQSGKETNAFASAEKPLPAVIKVIRRKKIRPDLQAS